MHEASLLLTGGTGFFGKSLLERIADGTFRVARLTLLSRDPYAFLAANPRFKRIENLHVLEGDIRTFSFPKETFDTIIHAATPASAKLEADAPDEMFSIIVEGTRHLLDFAKQCDCKRFLLTSSGAVYGVQPPEVSHIPESFPCNPVTAYGKGKLVAEHLCIAAGEKYGFTALLPRCFAFVGPYLPLDLHFAIGNFMRDCLNNRPLLINGDGTPLRSYLSADDLVAWLFKILLQGENGRVYNVGSEQALSIVELANLVNRCAGTTNEIIVRQHPVNEAPPSRYIPSTERARQELGLYQTVSLEEVLRRTLSYHQKK